MARMKKQQKQQNQRERQPGKAPRSGQTDRPQQKKHHKGRHQRQKKIKKTNRLSEHFSKKDFICREGDCENSLKVSLGLIGGLELLRSRARARVNVVRGYLCPEAAEKYNKLRRNLHTSGIAADITIENKTLEEVFLLAETVPEFKGIGLNLSEKHVHVDTRKEAERVMWVIDKHEQYIELTDKNRHLYLPERTPIHDETPDQSDASESADAIS